MGLWEVGLIALGLSMDAFAVSLCRGIHMKKVPLKAAAITALFFGVFQAAMPVLGWLLGSQFERYITGIDHWIAFGLLALIGAKMIFEAMQKENCEVEEKADLNIKILFLLAVATSIDALAVGITFTFLNVAILPAILTIGAVTFILSFAGVYIGNRCGIKLKAKAEITGGAVLILIGIKILLEHLEILF